MRSPFLGALAAALAWAAAPAAARAEQVPVDGDRWEIAARESRVVEHLGRKALLLKGGVAAVGGSAFGDGVIEVDVSFTGERGFMGVAWRMQDLQSFEEFYLRPHQSGNPDANQYQPVFHGNTAWQLFTGERFSTPTTYHPGRWTHLKIVVAGTRAEVYIDDMTRPALAIDELMRGPGSGRVGLTAGNFAPAIFSNFSYQPMKQAPALVSRARPPEPTPPGTIATWQVSGALDGRSLGVTLEAGLKKRLGWTRLQAEPAGVTNLGRLQPVEKDRDTAIARVTLRSSRDQVKRLRFGFSDAVKVYLDGRLLYEGDDGYRSRDYRFLGSVGLFDAVPLALHRGDNELWLAVTERFGGWGVLARLDDLDGVTLVAD